MPIRFQRRIRLLPFLWLNLSKTGISFSFGTRGARINFDRNGPRASVGIPGTGLRYETKRRKSK